MQRACILACAMVLACAAWAGAAGERPPNVILFMADDLGVGDLGCYGQEKIKTPNIDRLAAQGVRFTRFYSGSPVCAPARCVLLTGRHPGKAYIRDNGDPPPDVAPEGQVPIPDTELTIAEMLKGKGYATACVGKWGLGYPGSEGDPTKQGFDLFYGYNCQRQAHNYYPTYLWRNDRKVTLAGNTRGISGEKYAPDMIHREALRFIRENKDTPFFLYYAEVIPHLALQVPGESMKPYKKAWEEDPPYEGGSEGYLPHATPRRAYAAMVTHMDNYIGRITALLEELGIDDNTLILFTSDNGPTHLTRQVDVDFFNSAAGMRGLKGSVYEGGIHVPLIARWPGRIAAGKTSDHVAAFTDVMPTLAELAGVKKPRQADGLSLLPTLLGKGEQPRHEFLMWDFAGYGGQLAVRIGDWKAVKQGLRKNPNGPWELYDLAGDPREQRDVAALHADVVEQVDRVVAEHRTEPKLEVFRFGKYAE